MAQIKNEVPTDIKKGQLVSIDVEMFGQELGRLHRPGGTFACISVAVEGRSEVYQLYDSADMPKLVKAVSPGTWVMHNALYDLRQMSRYAKIKPRYIHDTMIVEQSNFGGYYIFFSLSDLVRRWLGIEMSKEVREQFSDATEMTPEMKEYAALDALLTLDVANEQLKAFKDSRQFNAYKLIDEPSIFPFLDMPGARVDVDGWIKMTEDFQAKATELETELGVNVMSWKQVIAAAKKQCGLHLRNTQAKTLLAYQDFPFIKSVLDTRMYRKAVSTYGLNWLKAVEDDGKVYASYNIVGAETGRTSCKNPNLQNIPARRMPEYRARFIPSDGCVIMVSDVSQQEPRIEAYESKDETLLNAFKTKEDLHLYVARQIFDDPNMEKKDPRRHVGKTINLGTSYGLTSYGLAERIGCTEEEAERFLTGYFNRFPGVFSWIGTQRQAAFSDGYVSTASGRRIYINPYDRQWENNAINAPIQGGAADFTKMWITKYWKNCIERDLPYVLIINVHDELVLDVPKPLIKKERKALLDAFDETAETLYPGIPFEHETEVGMSWGVKQFSEESYVESEDDDG